MNNEMVKITNPYNYTVGLRLMDGVREVVVYPRSFIYLNKDEVYYINNMCGIFRKKKLIIHDDEINRDFGLLDKENVAYLSDEEIKEILLGNFLTMKKKFGEIKEKHLIDRIIEIAKGIDDLAAGKVKFLSELSGYSVEEIMGKKEEEK